MLVLLAACAGEPDRPGSPAVYDQIEASADCAGLQATFDRSMANHDRAQPGTEERRWTLAYAMAADDRMRAVGCHG